MPNRREFVYAAPVAGLYSRLESKIHEPDYGVIARKYPLRKVFIFGGQDWAKQPVKDDSVMLPYTDRGEFKGCGSSSCQGSESRPADCPLRRLRYIGSYTCESSDSAFLHDEHAYGGLDQHGAQIIISFIFGILTLNPDTFLDEQIPQDFELCTYSNDINDEGMVIHLVLVCTACQVMVADAGGYKDPQSSGSYESDVNTIWSRA